MSAAAAAGNEPVFSGLAADFELAFLFLSRLFLEPPDEIFLEELSREDLLDDWPLPPNCDMAVGLAMMKNGLAEAAACGWKDLASDYVDLFAGGRLLAPPFESVYRGEDRLMFDDATLDVREFYRKHGLEVPEKNAVPDDHIGYELLFLAWLCGRAASITGEEPGKNPAEVCDTGDLESARNGDVLFAVPAEAEDAVAGFLSEHLLPWSGRFASAVIDKAATSFYRGAAQLMNGTLRLLTRSVGLADPHGH